MSKGCETEHKTDHMNKNNDKLRELINEPVIEIAPICGYFVLLFSVIKIFS